LRVSERTEAKKVFDTYVEAGGNFMDTADSYQFGDRSYDRTLIE
jgi:aryl-alcohol dehydrogenase-like predicted oxidoreductase